MPPSNGAGVARETPEASLATRNDARDDQSVSALLQIEDLQVEGRLPDHTYVPIVRHVGLEVKRGEVIALIGESGAGKSTVALAALGYARPGCHIVGGRVMFRGTDITKLDSEGRRRLRGRHVAYIAQSAAAAFNAALTIGYQVTESPLVHGVMSEAEASERAEGFFRQLLLPEPDRIARKYPHQVSGGQLQRLMAAMAMACGPELLVLDEPTTAIDVTTQVEVLTAFKDLIRHNRMAAIYVTHDLSVVVQIADRIIVLYGGKVIEEGSTEQILHEAREAYTRELMAAVRPPPKVTVAGRAQEGPEADNPIAVETKSLRAGYGGPRDGSAPKSMVLFDVDVAVPRGEVVGVIGESGCGKSTLARVISGLLPAASGELRFNGASLNPSLRHRTRDELRRIQIVFQMPDVSFNPKKRVEQALGRPLELYFGMDGGRRSERVRELLEMVELPGSYAGRYPTELSGGEKQRVNLARALAAEPDLILCDEVTSALDTVVGAAVIELLRHLQKSLGNAYVFISHDLSTVASFADRIVVLYAGRVVEQGTTREVLSPPYHPYTRLLLASVPELRQGWLEDVRNTREAISGIARAVRITFTGCPFFERCPVAIDGVCDRIAPPRRNLSADHVLDCHREVAELETTT